MNVVGLKSGAVGLNQEATNLVVLIFDLRPNDGYVGDRPGRDPHFLAVDYVFVAHFFRASAHEARNRTEVGFSQTEAAKLFAFLHRWKPFLLLLLAAELVNRIHDQPRLHAHKTAHAGVSALQFLRHEPVFHVAHPGAAVAFQRRPEKTQIGHGFNQFARKSTGTVAFLNNRDQVVFNKLARGVAYQAFFVRQQGIVLDEIDTAKFYGRHDDLLMKWVPRTGRTPEGKHTTVAG